MKIPPMVIAFDDGSRVEVKPASRDLLHLEREGVSLDESPPIETSYLIAHLALKRMERQGQIPDGVTVPATATELMDLADLEPEDDDDQGEGSGQVATTG